MHGRSSFSETEEEFEVTDLDNQSISEKVRGWNPRRIVKDHRLSVFVDELADGDGITDSSEIGSHTDLISCYLFPHGVCQLSWYCHGSRHEGYLTKGRESRVRKAAEVQDNDTRCTQVRIPQLWRNPTPAHNFINWAQYCASYKGLALSF
jgi:hypothetical protein